MRTVPEEFNRRLALTFGSDYQMRWNETVHRYELLSPTASGGTCSQFWCWFYDPQTGQPTVPDVTGLHPFRELDATALWRGPGNLAVILEALEQISDVIQFVVGVKRVLLDAQLLTLTHHDVDRVVQNSFDQEIAQFGHEHLGLCKVA